MNLAALERNSKLVKLENPKTPVFLSRLVPLLILRLSKLRKKTVIVLKCGLCERAKTSEFANVAAARYILTKKGKIKATSKTKRPIIQNGSSNPRK